MTATAVTLNELEGHSPVAGLFFTAHTVRDGRESLSHRLTTVERVIDFSIFDLGLTPGPKVTNSGCDLLYA